MPAKILLFLPIYIICALSSSAQLLSWSPQFAEDDDNITITVDATKGNQGLLGFAGNVYVHIGVITNLSTSPTDWKYSKFTWGSTDPAALATPAGTNKWSYSITNIRAFFNVPAGETILKIAILFREGNCSQCIAQRNANGSDMYVPVYSNAQAVRFNQPLMQPLFNPEPEPISKTVGDNISIEGLAKNNADLSLTLNGNTIQTATNAVVITANPTLTTAGAQVLILTATNGSVTTKDTIEFFVAPAPTILPLPPGVRDGINYEAGNTSVVLVLYAPGKTRVSILGQFPGYSWTEDIGSAMNKTPDGNYWWKRITGLTPGTEYAFQYLVNGSLKIADPYSEKILDPWNDPFISSATYPNLMPYPSQTSGIVSVLQTAQPSYNWAINNFSRPDKKGLIIYELLLRDFLDAHDWKTLRDTLGYFKRLGVNAIELMPFNEFEGNLSWGYNPDFFFAPDKYYGTKNSLKEFIDSCHSKGIAVIMDMVLNHVTGLSPLAALYWNAALNRPAANNPWLNEEARHPFNVFNDFNHESAATKYHFSRVVEHWLQEYKIDGFRFDLSKGFTQFNSGGDVGLWSQYDASRVAIWKAYYDTLQLKSPGSYVILEHFAANNEEKELSDYGMLFWGNSNANFSQAAMGYSTPDPGGNTWNFEYGIFKVRGWTNPYLITYMESHDEERLMYKNIQFGNSSGTYNTKELGIALKRMELDAAFFFSIPGPKLIWQFGEMGYDFSINRCGDGTINNACRTDPKPIRWDYLQNQSRKRTFEIYSSLAKLRFHPLYKSAFVSDRVTQDLASAVKWIKVTTDTSNLLVVGNFGVATETGTITFQNAGTWYDYLTGATITATGAPQSITLQPGEYHLYLNRNVTSAVTTPVPFVPAASDFTIALYGNPVIPGSFIELKTSKAAQTSISIYNSMGQRISQKSLGLLVPGTHKISAQDLINSKLAAGHYFIQVRQNDSMETLKFVLF